VKLQFESIIAYSTGDAEEAAHFFEHAVGLTLRGEDGGVRFYQLDEDTTLMVDTTGRSPGAPPYLLFSADDLVEAAEHFLERGCAVRDVPWAQGAGFLASTPEGHTVAVISAAALEAAGEAS
jgi:predicted enzyme related to lactoylglutathione lyase